MPPRSSWKGFIKLSLVSVPVKAYTATASGGDIRLRQLHKECHSPIRNRVVCPLHGEIDRADLVSGYEYAKGQFVEVDPEELQALRSQSDKSITIDGFVAPEEVEPIFYAGKNYYLVPDGAVGQKPYALLHQGMVDEGVCAVAQIVLSGRVQLVLIRPVGKLLVLNTLSYESKLKKSADFEDEITEVSMTADELKLTKLLVSATKMQEFPASDYTDTYTENLTQLIEAKVEGKQIVTASQPRRTRGHPAHRRAA